MSNVRPLTVDAYFRVLVERSSFELSSDATPYDHVRTSLDLDSLQLFELLVITEMMADVLVPPETLPPIERLVDLYDYYLSCVASSDSVTDRD